MGSGHRSLKPLWLVLPYSALFGAVAALALLTMARSLAPQSHVGSVLIFVPPVVGDSSYGRRRLEVALLAPEFMTSIVQATNLSQETAAQFARSIRIRPADSSPALSEVRAKAQDPQALEDALNEGRRRAAGSSPSIRGQTGREAS